MRRPEVLARLWATADPGQALSLLAEPSQLPAALVAADRPPVIRIIEPERQTDTPLVVRDGSLPIRARVTSEGGRPIRSLRILVDGRQGPSFDLAQGQPEVDKRAELTLTTLTPGLHRINVVATNDRGRERIEGFDVEYLAPR